MLCDVVRRRRRRRRRRWAHAPVIHAASHFDQKKRVAWVPISIRTCGSFFYNYGAPLGGPSGRRSSAINAQKINNGGQYSLGHLCNCINFLCFYNGVLRRQCYPFQNALLLPSPTPPPPPI